MTTKIDSVTTSTNKNGKDNSTVETETLPQNDLPHDRYNILIEFAHVHLDFHRAELESVLSMYDIIIGRDCVEIPLPNHDQNIHNLQNTIHNRPFLILSFSYQQIKQRFDMNDYNNHDHHECNDQANHNNIITQPNSNSKKPTLTSIFSRCTLIRSVIELWGIGNGFQSCAMSVRLFSQSNVAKLELLAKHYDPNTSWKITVHCLGSKYDRNEQNEFRNNFSFLNFPGKVQMENPLHEYILIREIELNSNGSPIYPRHDEHKQLILENDARPPLAVYFGRTLGGKRDWRTGGRVERYNLKKRVYLGPTSMDNELSFIMTNLAKVNVGSFVFDPFAGTGSILLTCGLQGAYCFGTDIDIRVLRGRSDKENVFTNFQQYNLTRPDLVRSDNAVYHRHYITTRPSIYDAIICDPPYGIRAGARQSGSKLDQPRPVNEEDRHDHIAQTKPYPVSDVMADLLDVAARTLVMGGRLVYIIPSMTDFNVETDLPQHECLKLVHVCYQPLQSELGRRVVTMEKFLEYDESKRSSYLEKAWVHGKASAEKCANIREKLLEAAKLKPDYEEKAAFRRIKRKETKEARKMAKKRETQTIDEAHD